jgi:hypothetical protein
MHQYQEQIYSYMAYKISHFTSYDDRFPCIHVHLMRKRKFNPVQCIGYQAQEGMHEHVQGKLPYTRFNFELIRQAFLSVSNQDIISPHSLC